MIAVTEYLVNEEIRDREVRLIGENGEQLLRDFAAKCAELANLDKQPKLEGRNMSIFLSPKPQAPAKKPGRPKEEKPQPAEEAKE